MNEKERFDLRMCSQDETLGKIELAEKLLREKYGEHFIVYDVGKSFGTLTNDTFTASCYAKANPGLRFHAEIENEGSYMTDEYMSCRVGAMLEEKIVSIIGEEIPEYLIKVETGNRYIERSAVQEGLNLVLANQQDIRFFIYFVIKKERVQKERLYSIFEKVADRITLLNGAVELYEAEEEQFNNVKEYFNKHAHPDMRFESTLKNLRLDYLIIRSGEIVNVKEKSHISARKFEGHTDRDMLIATQIAYYDFRKEIIRANGGEATLRELLSQDRSIEKKLERSLVKAEEKKDILKIRRAKRAFELFEEIRRDGSWYGDWIIREIKDDNKVTGFYGCLLETNQNSAIIAFRGSESKNKEQIQKDWIEADFGLLNSTLTEQQKIASEFTHQISFDFQYEHYGITGHSLGGNLTSHAVVSADESLKKRLSKCINFDGPGFSDEYLHEHKNEVHRMQAVLRHYQWSFIGALLHQIPGTHEKSVRTDKLVSEKYDLESLTQKHDTCFVLFDSKNQVLPGEMDYFAKNVGNFSRSIDSCPEWIGNALIWAISRLITMPEEERGQMGLVFITMFGLFAEKYSAAAVFGILSLFSIVAIGYIDDEFYGRYLIPEFCRGITETVKIVGMIQKGTEKMLLMSSEYVRVDEGFMI